MFMKQLKKKKGQSTLEYIILVTGVIAVLLILLNPNTGLFTKAFNRTILQGTDGMEEMANALRKSRFLQGNYN